MPIDKNRTFVPLHIAVCTISDTRTQENDHSGLYLCKALKSDGHILQDRVILRDDLATIVLQLKTWISQDNIDIILCTGGTGLTDRDVTPEALEKVVEKWIPGFGELFRYLSYKKKTLCSEHNTLSENVRNSIPQNLSPLLFLSSKNKRAKHINLLERCSNIN